MKDASNFPANAGIALPDAEEIIRRQRAARGKPPLKLTPLAIDLVRNNEPVIRQLREAGYKQEDAVLLLLDLGEESHKPDTLRKAIASVLGAWNSQTQDDAEVVADTVQTGVGTSVSSTDPECGEAAEDVAQTASIVKRRKL